MSEKRKQPSQRNFVRYENKNSSIKLKADTSKDFFEIKIIDINKKGLCVSCESKINLNKIVTLKVLASDFSPKFECLGSIVWADKIVNNLYMYGILVESELWMKYTINYDLYRIKSGRRLLDKIDPSAMSIDVTNLCNLRCKHCFWSSYKSALPEETDLKILHKVKSVLHTVPSITNLTWYGGEPLLNETTRKIVEKGLSFKKNNLVITNGCYEIPNWNEKYNVHFAVSIDGTAKVHNFIRGNEVYQKAKKNILLAIKRNIPISIIYCINALNIGCIAEFIEEWGDTDLDGIGFTAWAPLKDKYRDLNLTKKDRDRAVKILLDLKKKYVRIVYNSPLMIELLRDKYGKEIAANCLMNIANEKVDSIHMCNDGNIRKPCALGEEADCLECRSITTIALHAGIVLKNRESMHSLLRMYHSNKHRKQDKKNDVLYCSTVK